MKGFICQSRQKSEKWSAFYVVVCQFSMWIYLSLLWRKTSLVYSVLKLPKLPITRNPFSVTQTKGSDWNSRKINHCAWSRLITGKSGGRSESLEEKQNNEETLFIYQFSNFPWSSCPICIDKGSDKVALARSFPECRPRYFNLRDPYIKRKQFNITCL